MSFPYPAWQVVDAEDTIAAVSMAFNYDGTASGNGTFSKTLTRVPWNNDYRYITPIPDTNFVAIRKTAADLSVPLSTVGNDVFFTSTPISVSGITDLGWPVSFNLIFDAVAYTKESRCFWYCTSTNGGASSDTFSLDMFDYTTNGRTRASRYDAPVTITNVQINTGSRIVACDSTSGLTAGMWVVSLNGQVANVIGSSSFLLSRPALYTGTYPTLDCFGGDVTDAGGGNVNFGASFEGVSGDLFDITIS